MKNKTVISIILLFSFLFQTVFAAGDFEEPEAVSETEQEYEYELEAEDINSLEDAFLLMKNPAETASVYNLRIEGSPVVGEELRIDYDCGDVDFDTKKLKVFWVAQNTPYVKYIGHWDSDTAVAYGEGMFSYTIPEEIPDIYPNHDKMISPVGKYITAYIKSVPGQHNNDNYTAIAIGPIMADKPEKPMVSGVTIRNCNSENGGVGVLVNDIVEGTYSYCGVNEEGESTYQWYYADTEDGDYQPIPGATEKEYCVQNAYYKKHLRFAVTPKDSEGKSGTTVESINQPQVGNAAYNAFVGKSMGYDNMGIRNFSSSVTIVNGIFGAVGGAMSMYNNTNIPDLAIQLDLNRKLKIDSLDIRLTNCDYYTLQYFDDNEGQWKTLLENCNPTADKQMSFDMVEARYFKVLFDRHRSNGPEIQEISLFTKQDFDPTITLNGDKEVNLLIGEDYVEQGASADDPEDGELDYTVDGEVDTTQVGEYTLIYTAKDSAGNQASVTRIVSVAEGFKTEGDELYHIIPQVSSGQDAERLTDGNEYTGFTGSESAVTMTFDLGKTQYLSHMLLESAKDNIKSILIEGSKDGTSWSNMYSGTETDANFVPNNIQYVKVTIEFTSGGFDLRTMEMSFDDRGRVMGAKEALKLEGNLSALTENLGLPKNGEFDTTITWKTSDASVITENGTITRNSSADKSAVLTAQITSGEVTDEKTFDITVKKKAVSGSSSGGGGGSSSSGSNKGSSSSNGGVIVGGNVTPNRPPLPTYPPQEILNGDFIDIKEHWANEYILRLKEQDIVTGRADNIFDPDGQITREEFVKIILGALGLEKADAVSSFCDVPEEAWSYPYVSAAKEWGIISGISDDLFGAGRQITRQDMAVIAFRAAAAAKRDVSSGEERSFTDAGEIFDYAKEAVGALVRAGILSGDNNSNFRPKANATRAEAAKIACMLIDLPTVTTEVTTPASTEKTKDTSYISAPFDLEKATLFLNWTPQGIVKETEEDLYEKAKAYIDLSEKELVKKVTAEERALESLGKRAGFEAAVARMSLLYLKTKDEKYARSAILAMNAAAQKYDKVPKVQSGMENLFPEYCIFAYNNLYDSPLWDTISGETGNDCREAVEDWFTKISLNAYENKKGFYMSNLVGYGLRSMAAAAVVMDRPDLVRKVIELLDGVYDDREWFADGMWHEGTISYSAQIIETCDAAVTIISYYTDPEGYVDDRLGLSLKRTNLYDLRWPVRGVGTNVNKYFNYPNGYIIPLNDTHPVKPKNANITEPIKEEYLNNIELNHFGFFSLTVGNTTDAQTATLYFPQQQMGGGGHMHYCFLPMTLFGGGTDVLPDQGYPFVAGASNRFFHMSGLTHNQSFITPVKAAGNTTRDLAQAQLLAYDDGKDNGKQIQVVEASECMSKAEGIDTKRRMLVTMKTSDSTSYVFDMQRLKGGSVHENFLRASENENCTLTTELELKNKQMTLPDYVASIRGRGGVAAGSLADKITTEKIGKGDSDFSFSWKGEETGTAVNMFIKGEPNTNIAFSKMPTFRRTMDDQINLKDAFPNWHFYQRRDVDPEDVTKFSGVYEAVRDGQTGYVESVEWTDIDPEYPMCSVAKITSKEYVDYIYVSNDKIERSYDGITFSGELAVLRTKGGKPVWGYLYSEGKLSYGSFSLTGNPRQEFYVTSTEGTEFDADNYKLNLSSPVKNSADVKDRWVMEILGDGSGRSHKILKAENGSLWVNNLPGYQITEEGAVMQCYPTVFNTETGKLDEHATGLKNEKQYIAQGDVSAFIDIPIFKKAQ